jgi:hypothetical protein
VNQVLEFQIIFVLVDEDVRGFSLLDHFWALGTVGIDFDVVFVIGEGLDDFLYLLEGI